jgi:outer membrane protein
MKKNYFPLILALTFILCGASLSAQRYAFVDMQYIMSNIPAYEAAQEQLNQLSQKWEKEIKDIYAEVEQLYKKYQTESVLLSPEMKAQREEEIIQLENNAKKLQRQYFGPDGEMAQRQQALFQPIQEKVANAIREIAERDNFDAVFDLSGGAAVVYVNPRQNISDDVLELLGYSK